MSEHFRELARRRSIEEYGSGEIPPAVLEISQRAATEARERFARQFPQAGPEAAYTCGLIAADIAVKVSCATLHSQRHRKGPGWFNGFGRKDPFEKEV